jgi:arabinogalactan oligomer / maltooligosaccharide transport system permease protein
MVGMSGRRKVLYVLAFTLPTILGLLIFNIYPTILNTYTSFTNRNKFRPYPDCSITLNNILVPYCWPAFEGNIPTRGTGKPFVIVEPVLANYNTILGDVFTLDGLLNLALLVACLVPLILAFQIDKRLDKQMERKIKSWMVWLAGIVLALAILLLWGLTAWKDLSASGDFVAVVLKTIAFVVLRVPFTFALGLLLALIVSSPGLPLKGFWRVVLFIPWAASSVAILTSLVWQFFFREQGTINQVLSALIPSFTPIAWLRDPVYAFAIIILVDIWYSYPFFMIAILGAVSAISNDVYEAADLDGANYWKQLTSITLPLIRPAILPAIVLTSITAFQMFGTVWAITQGGPTAGAGKPGATELVMVYAYKQVFQSQNYGTATAFATVVFIFLFAATMYSLRMTQLTKGANA